MQKVIRKICNLIEHFSINRVNIIKTIYINFRLLPYSQAQKFPIIVYGSTKFSSLKGDIIIDGDVKKGMLEINKSFIYAPNLNTIPSQLVIDGKWIIKGHIEIGNGTKILVNSGAFLSMENNRISDMCNIVCYKQITISDGTRITHRCQVIDTNNHFIANLNNRTIPDCKRSIHIGKFVWVGNSTTISAGAILPNNCIVTSNSLVNKNYGDIPNFSLLGGIPAKVISTGLRRVYNQSLEYKLINYYSKSNSEPYCYTDEPTFI